MSRISRILLFAFFAMFLLGCSVSVNLQPPWRHSTLRLYPPHEAAPLTATPSVTAGVLVTPTTTPVTPTAPVLQPVHVLDIRPLTVTAPFSLTTLVDVSSTYFRNACDATQTLARMPASLKNGTVVAAVTYRSGAVPLEDSESSRAAFSPALSRKLYWNGGSNLSAPDCSSPGAWLWQEALLMPTQDGSGVFTPTLLSLPATSVCELAGGFTPSVFVTMTNNAGEWPHLLYLLDSDDKPALLLLQQDRCSSGSGCTAVRTVCQSLFEDGAWRDWCTSLCS